MLERNSIAFLNTRRAFRGYEVAYYNRGYSSSFDSFFSFLSFRSFMSFKLPKGPKRHKVNVHVLALVGVIAKKKMYTQQFLMQRTFLVMHQQVLHFFTAIGWLSPYRPILPR